MSLTSWKHVPDISDFFLLVAFQTKSLRQDGSNGIWALHCGLVLCTCWLLSDSVDDIVNSSTEITVDSSWVVDHLWQYATWWRQCRLSNPICNQFRIWWFSPLYPVLLALYYCYNMFYSVVVITAFAAAVNDVAVVILSSILCVIAAASCADTRTVIFVPSQFTAMTSLVVCVWQSNTGLPELSSHLSTFGATFWITGDHFWLQMRNGNRATFGLLFASVCRRDFWKICQPWSNSPQRFLLYKECF